MNPTKKVLILTLCFLVLFQFSVFGAATPPDVSAESAILVDANTGQILYEKNIDESLSPASITKIMTAIIVLENVKDFSEMVTISESVAELSQEGMQLNAGETLSVEDLFNAMVIGSANDASEALAEYVGDGSVDKFVELMNAKAQEIGALNTSFKNPHGLTEEGHVTTARDIAVIAQYALGLDYLKEVMLKSEYRIFREGTDTEIETTNNLLNSYEGITGMKTGYTSKAGYCFVGSATRDDKSFIAVVLKSKSAKSRFTEAAALMDYGFDNFQMTEIQAAKSPITELEIKNGKPVPLVTEKAFSLMLQEDEESQISKNVILEKDVKAPVKKDTVLGKVQYLKDGSVIGEVNLVAEKNVRRNITTYLWFRLFILLLIIMALRFIYKLQKRRKYGRVDVSQKKSGGSGFYDNFSNF